MADHNNKGAAAEDGANFCWQSRESVDHSSDNSGSSSPTRSLSTSSRHAKRSLPRQRQSVGQSASPLHVAALFASAAKAAVVGPSSPPQREERLFMNSDEVFRVWEENMRLAEEESAGDPLQNGTAQQPQRGVRKNASLHERGDGARVVAMRRSKASHASAALLQRAQSTDVVDVFQQQHLSKKGALKLSTGSMPSAHLDVLSLSRQRSSSIQQPKCTSASQQAMDAKRRFSGVHNENGAELKRVALDNDYNLLKEIGVGQFGSLQLAEHKQSRQRVLLKLFPRPSTRQADFMREFQLSRFLSPHPNIVDTFEGCFETDDESAFFFAQEWAITQQTLREYLTNHPGGIGEQAAKAVMLKVLAALEFMHNEGIVHRDVRAENVLLFDAGKFTRVKLGEFGRTLPADSVVRHTETVNSYHSPELCEKVPNETYTVGRAVDVWAAGILMAYTLKGKFPWQKATIMCKPYWEWDQWTKRKVPQLPKYWELFSEKALKLFKHTLQQKPKDRWEVREMRKLVEKERMLKCKVSLEDAVYYPQEEGTSAEKGARGADMRQKKSVIGQWINHTLNAMSEISEQVVSARDDD